MTTYKLKQRELQTAKLHDTHAELFNFDSGDGNYGKYKSLKFILVDGANNLYGNIVNGVYNYFTENNIAWWGDNKTYPTGHLLSSQIQCINFLFALRNDKEAILKIAQLFNESIEDIHSVIGDKDNGYIAFEFAYNNATFLGEIDTNAKRGEFCTSIDAIIIGLKQGKKILIPIEWKFTEEYLKCENKALEPRKGKTRQSRYNNLITKSNQLKTPQNFEESVYYYEPFYELMRQTLLVEQMVVNGIADDYLHIVVIPSENKDILEANYTFSKHDLQTTWRNSIINQKKFKIIDSIQLLQIIMSLSNYSDLATYLKQRYY